MTIFTRKYKSLTRDVKDDLLSYAGCFTILAAIIAYLVTCYPSLLGSSVKMVSCVTIQTLPEEMMMKIFCCLDLSDLATVLLVCRRWKEVAESPWLWKRLEVVVGQMKVNNIGILGTRRLESVKRVRLLSKYHPDEEEAEAVFQAIEDHEGINELNISQNEISKVNATTLAKAVNSMEKVNLFNAKLTNMQIDALFEQMARETKLKVLSMGCVNISGVNPEVVSAGLNKINTARLCNTAVTTKQLDALFKAMADKTQLKEIDLGHNNLAGVDAEVLYKGLKKIETVKLYDTNLSRRQIEYILGNTGNQLKTLDICFNSAIRETPRSLFIRAESFITELSYLLH